MCEERKSLHEATRERVSVKERSHIATMWTKFIEDTRLNNVQSGDGNLNDLRNTNN